MFQGRFRVRYGPSWYNRTGVLTTVPTGDNKEDAKAHGFAHLTVAAQADHEGAYPVVLQSVKNDNSAGDPTCKTLQGACSGSPKDNVVLVWDYENKELVIERASCVVALNAPETTRTRASKRNLASGGSTGSQKQSKEKKQKIKSPRQIINALSRNPEYRKRIESTVRNPATDLLSPTVATASTVITSLCSTGPESSSVSTGTATNTVQEGSRRPTYVPQMRSRPDFREISRPGAASTEANNRGVVADPRESSLFLPRKKSKPTVRQSSGSGNSHSSTSPVSDTRPS
eukprot:gb/GECG01012477.1/.p1 GENE.gb/GECG01012477.1/~~gb/GECG01012477.1/.p1  ORF type:complete len:287 (+),score=32.45 gb/GECG01012477.1/:1-861(+)